MIRLSPTQISAWCNCHYAWYLQYVEKRSRPPMGLVPKYGIILHNLLESLVNCHMHSEKWVAPTADEYVDDLRNFAKNAGEVVTAESVLQQMEIVLSHVEVFQVAFLPKLQPVATEEAWEWCIETETGEVVVYCRGDLRDGRGFWVDHKLKSKVPSDRDTLPAADTLELMIQTVACPHTKDAVAQIYGKTTRKQSVIPLGLTGGPDPRYPDREALEGYMGRVVAGVAAGMAAGDQSPTGLWCERWGRQSCYWCDWRKTGACKYAPKGI